MGSVGRDKTYAFVGVTLIIVNTLKFVYTVQRY